MVLYFSATGNTEFIAKELAKRLDDSCLNLLSRIKENDHTPIHSEKPLVICAPVYVCEMPRFLDKYLKKQTFLGSKDVYFIFSTPLIHFYIICIADNIIEKGSDCNS